jgi:CHRD domain-containing protein
MTTNRNNKTLTYYQKSAKKAQNQPPHPMKKFLFALVIFLALSLGTAQAQWIFQAFLSGINENPPNGSPASGFCMVTLNAAQTQITVDLNWSGLTANATASHIHGPGGAGTNAAVLFPFSGVPAATAGSIPTQSFAITPTQVSWLFDGYLYANVHTSTFPGGEIRGQLLLVPEPASASLIGLAAVTAVWRFRRSRR